METLQNRVSKAKLPIVAELGKSQISVHEFLNLAPGDVIMLHNPIKEGLKVMVGDRFKYVATPGMMKDKLAIQITEIVDEGVEEHDE